MGKIETDHTGSGGGITLSSDGTSLLLDGTAVGGGGGADLYAANTTGSTDPTASGTLGLAIGSSASANGSSSVAIGDTALANSTYSVAIGRQADGSQTGAISIGNSATATGYYGVAIGSDASAYQYGVALGRQAKTGTSAQYSVSIGQSYASGAHSFATGIANNTGAYGSWGANSIAMGYLAKATQSKGVAIGYSALSNVVGQIALGGTTNSVKISGTYTLPTTDGTANQVLTTDGAGAVTFATAGGGGGSPDLFAENYNGTSTKPVATGTNAVAVGLAYASGTNSFAAVIGDSTSTYGAQGASALAMGWQAKTTSNYGLAMGLRAVNTSSGSGIAIGADCTNTASAIALGKNCQSTQNYAAAFGNYAKSDVIGKKAYSGWGTLNGVGSSQQGTYVLVRKTTDATQTILTTNNAAISNTTRNRMFIGPNTAYAFTGMVVGRETGSTGDLAAAWQVQGLVKTASSGSPTLVTKVINVVDNTPSWGFDITTFNVTTGVVGIDFLATGQASKNISWVATITTTELINP